VNGVLYDAKGNFTYNLGRPAREAVHRRGLGARLHREAQVAFIEGEITDRGDLDVAALVSLTGATVTLELANGKVIALRDAWFAGEGTGNTEEGNISVRFEGKNAEEIS
jgi:hypothetical protein